MISKKRPTCEYFDKNTHFCRADTSSDYTVCPWPYSPSCATRSEHDAEIKSTTERINELCSGSNKKKN